MNLSSARLLTYITIEIGEEVFVVFEMPSASHLNVEEEPVGKRYLSWGCTVNLTFEKPSRGEKGRVNFVALLGERVSDKRTLTVTMERQLVYDQTILINCVIIDAFG